MLTQFSSFLALAATFTVVLSNPVPHHASQVPGPSNGAAVKAIYFITNEESNAVVALPVSGDGTLSQGTTTLTGGAGSVAVDAEGKPALPDALVGQSALTIAGNNIFAVNAGSNTLSMLSIDPRDPTKLVMVGQPVSIPGEFPNTVAASASNKLACVGTTGAKNGVSCSTFSKSGLKAMDGLRSFDLKQTTPPVGPTNTVSQLFFSDDEARLFATVKGDPAVNNTGFFSVFPIERNSCQGEASLASKDIRSSPDGTAVLFGSAIIPGSSSVFATDASFGGAVLSVDQSSNKATLVAKQAIDNQKATCWATVSAKTGSAFVTDVGVNQVVEMSLADASILSRVDLSANGDPGLIDLRAGGDFIYALSPGNGTTAPAITVLDVSKGQGSATMLQHFNPDGLGVSSKAMGMAVF